ncbi:MAG: hypothetical protein SOZ23_05190 [Methanosphaera sp.]|uniref:hypothetical protein n=1 Tax=Methanosphaera sp. TaxID=2666342 RepID=UPI0025DF3397|nr:hypothetical protein [Methanosphaera sp.]MCI5867551.1 hypothetical protein [Methanosphaera sp.]MDD6534018.1 hypothetical protein [Methanosphaera sp.]MDY3956172.1 hypothetical protein [Methanosphaera sp.]
MKICPYCNTQNYDFEYECYGCQKELYIFYTEDGQLYTESAYEQLLEDPNFPQDHITNPNNHSKICMNCGNDNLASDLVCNYCNVNLIEFYLEDGRCMSENEFEEFSNREYKSYQKYQQIHPNYYDNTAIPSKSPEVAVALGFIGIFGICGLGQLYAGNRQKALKMFLVGIILFFAIMTVNSALLFIYPIFLIYNIADGMSQLDDTHEENQQELERRNQLKYMESQKVIEQRRQQEQKALEQFQATNNIIPEDDIDDDFDDDFDDDVDDFDSLTQEELAKEIEQLDQEIEQLDQEIGQFDQIQKLVENGTITDEAIKELVEQYAGPDKSGTVHYGSDGSITITIGNAGYDDDFDDEDDDFDDDDFDDEFYEEDFKLNAKFNKKYYMEVDDAYNLYYDTAFYNLHMDTFKFKFGDGIFGDDKKDKRGNILYYIDWYESKLYTQQQYDKIEDDYYESDEKINPTKDFDEIELKDGGKLEIYLRNGVGNIVKFINDFAESKNLKDNENIFEVYLNEVRKLCEDDDFDFKDITIIY